MWFWPVVARRGAKVGQPFTGSVLLPQAEELTATKDDSNFDLSSGRDTLEEYGVQVFHGKYLPYSGPASQPSQQHCDLPCYQHVRVD